MATAFPSSPTPFPQGARGVRNRLILSPRRGGIQTDCRRAGRSAGRMLEPGGDLLAEEAGHAAAQVGTTVALKDHPRLPGNLHHAGVIFHVRRTETEWPA